jgi:uncharacterized membrane protein YoaK (UPF0700 family)
VFAAMMTGNFLFLGFGIAGAGGSSVAEPGLAVLAFLCGGVIGGFVAAFGGRGEGRRLRIGLGLEVALVGAATAVAAASTVRSQEAAGFAVIALLALAMGARNTIARRLGVPELPTTVLTIAVSSLGAGTTFAGASPEHLVPRFAAVLAMLAGAITGALLVRTSLALALGAATAATAIAALTLAAGFARARAPAA